MNLYKLHQNSKQLDHHENRGYVPSVALDYLTEEYPNGNIDLSNPATKRAVGMILEGRGAIRSFFNRFKRVIHNFPSDVIQLINSVPFAAIMLAISTETRPPQNVEQEIIKSANSPEWRSKVHPVAHAYAMLLLTHEWSSKEFEPILIRYEGLPTLRNYYDYTYTNKRWPALEEALTGNAPMEKLSAPLKAGYLHWYLDVIDTTWPEGVLELAKLRGGDTGIDSVIDQAVRHKVELPLDDTLSPRSLHRIRHTAFNKYLSMLRSEHGEESYKTALCTYANVHPQIDTVEDAEYNLRALSGPRNTEHLSIGGTMKR